MERWLVLGEEAQTEKIRNKIDPTTFKIFITNDTMNKAVLVFYGAAV